MSDLEIPLTERGISQAHAFGETLIKLLKDSTCIRFYTSPGVRNVQTLEIVLPRLPNNLNIQVEIEPLIVKQNWGKITASNKEFIEADRYKTGVLRYTFPTGESAKSMICRLALFKDKIFETQKNTGCDLVVFSHGFEFRVLLMIILGWEERLFESFSNLLNCEYRILTREASGKYKLNKPLKRHGLPITRLQKQSKIIG